METKSMSKAALVVLIAVCRAYSAITIIEPGYTVETYATYVDSVKSIPRHMVFDGNGNLYVAQQGTGSSNGSVWRITPAGVASEFATGFVSPYAITWGGGTGFGDFLYVGGDGITKVALNGATWPFTTGRCSASLAVDRTGNYDGYLYQGTGCSDNIRRIDTVGNATVFSNWPGPTNGGEPDGIAFDRGSEYGGLMYVATAYAPPNDYKSGLFKMNSSGTPTRFSSNLVGAWAIAFDNKGKFGGQLFAFGITSFGSMGSVYRVDGDGMAAALRISGAGGV